VAGHSPRDGHRWAGRPRHRHTDVPAARALLRAVHARLPPGHPLRSAIPGLPGSLDAHAPRPSRRLHGIQPAAHLHADRRGPARRRRRDLAGHRELAFRPRPPRHPAERARGGGSGHQRAPLENALPRGVGHDGRRRGRILRARAPGGNAGFRVRHARIRSGRGGDAVRRGRFGVGACHRRGHPRAPRGDAASRAGNLSPRDPGRHLRHCHHRHHAALARRALLDHPRSLVCREDAHSHSRRGRHAASTPSHVRARGHAAPLRGERVTDLRRPEGGERGELRGRRGRDPRNHRAEWRGQDDAVQRAERRALRGRRLRAARRRADAGPQDLRGLPHGGGAHLPGRAQLSPSPRPRQRDRRRLRRRSVGP